MISSSLRVQSAKRRAHAHAQAQLCGPTPDGGGPTRIFFPDLNNDTLDMWILMAREYLFYSHSSISAENDAKYHQMMNELIGKINVNSFEAFYKQGLLCLSRFPFLQTLLHLPNHITSEALTISPTRDLQPNNATLMVMSPDGRVLITPRRSNQINGIAPQSELFNQVNAKLQELTGHRAENAEEIHMPLYLCPESRIYAAYITPNGVGTSLPKFKSKAKSKSKAPNAGKAPNAKKAPKVISLPDAADVDATYYDLIYSLIRTEVDTTFRLQFSDGSKSNTITIPAFQYSANDARVVLQRDSGLNMHILDQHLESSTDHILEQLYDEGEGEGEGDEKEIVAVEVTCDDEAVVGSCWMTFPQLITHFHIHGKSREEHITRHIYFWFMFHQMKAEDVRNIAKYTANLSAAMADRVTSVGDVAEATRVPSVSSVASMVANDGDDLLLGAPDDDRVVRSKRDRRAAAKPNGGDGGDDGDGQPQMSIFEMFGNDIDPAYAISRGRGGYDSNGSDSSSESESEGGGSGSRQRFKAHRVTTNKKGAHGLFDDGELQNKTKRARMRGDGGEDGDERKSGSGGFTSAHRFPDPSESRRMADHKSSFARRHVDSASIAPLYRSVSEDNRLEIPFYARLPGDHELNELQLIQKYHNQHIQVHEMLGGGSQGVVYRACVMNDCTYIVKAFVFGNDDSAAGGGGGGMQRVLDAVYEATCHMIAQHRIPELTPQIYDIFTLDKIGTYIIYEKGDMSLDQLITETLGSVYRQTIAGMPIALMQQVIDVYYQYWANGCIHFDARPGNFLVSGVQVDEYEHEVLGAEKVVINDWGWCLIYLDTERQQCLHFAPEVIDMFWDYMCNPEAPHTDVVHVATQDAAIRFAKHVSDRIIADAEMQGALVGELQRLCNHLHFLRYTQGFSNYQLAQYLSAYVFVSTFFCHHRSTETADEIDQYFLRILRTPSQHSFKRDASFMEILQSCYMFMTQISDTIEPEHTRGDRCVAEGISVSILTVFETIMLETMNRRMNISVEFS